jgi:hypothetical protein
VVLAGDQHLARVLVQHRVVRAVMAELHLERAAAGCEAEQLVAEADAERRRAGRNDLADRFDGVLAGLGSPGPLERNTPSGFCASTSRAGVVAGTTVRWHPRCASMRRMLCFAP